MVMTSLEKPQPPPNIILREGDESPVLRFRLTDGWTGLTAPFKRIWAIVKYIFIGKFEVKQ